MFIKFSNGCIRNFTKYNRGKTTVLHRLYKNSINTISKCEYTIQHNKIEFNRCLHTTSALNKIIPYILSDIGEGIKEVSVKEWFIKEGDHIEQFQNICEVQSDKASVTITSRYDGKVAKIHHKVDDIALVGKPLIDVDVQDDDESSSSNDDSAKSNDTATETNEQYLSSESQQEIRGKVLATPAVRRIAMQNKLNLANVPSTGKGGRVLKEDILKYLNISADESNDVEKMKSKEQKPTATIQSDQDNRVPYVNLNKMLAQDKVVKIKGFTKAMVKTMNEALKIPHFVYSDEIDVTELMKVRLSIKKAAEDTGMSVTFMPFFIKAASLSLLQYPILNSSVDEHCENVIYKAAHNIGVAMDTPNGLAVPVIKSVQDKNILEIAAELNRLQKDGTKGSFKTEDLVGGTFSLSNIGIIGGTYTKPVILTPQVSIGALGKIQVLPRFDKDFNVIKAHIICVSWSADHRIVDGVTMARFSNKWKFYVENPSHLMLGL